MKLNSAGWLLSAIGVGVLVAANAIGCSDPVNPNTGGAGGEGTSSSSSSSSSTGGKKDDGLWIGASCAKDDDCAAEGAPADSGGVCLNSTTVVDAFAGAPAGGYCSKPCMKLDDCPGVGNVCYGAANGKPGVCVLGCEAGQPFTSLQTPLDEFKCHGRDDVFCAKVDNTARACLPGCGSDVYCENGWTCHPRSNSCVQMPPMGDAMGAACSQMNPSCAGTCLLTSMTGPGLCSQKCVMGGDFQNDCGNGFADGLCILSLPMEGVGDAGFCAPGCTDHGKCLAGGMFCVDLGAPNGFCVPGLVECPMGQADCDKAIMSMDAPMGATCQLTKDGKSYCLQPKYPLGDAAPPMDGGADSGMGGAGGMGGGGMMDAGADSGDGG